MGERCSGKSVKRCAPISTTDCITFVAEGDFPCLDICTGDTLSEVQVQIIDKICQLVGDVDMSTVAIPTCFSAAFSTGDKTILGFIDFLLQTACQQQVTIAGLPTTNDPLVTIDYKCCSDNPCVISTEVVVSQHLQNIVNCLCSLKSTVTTLETTVSDLQDEVASLTTQFNSLNTQVSKIVTGINNANAADNFPITIS